MKLEPPLPNGRGPPEPSTTTSIDGFAGAACTQAGNKIKTAAARTISVFMDFLLAFIRGYYLPEVCRVHLPSARKVKTAFPCRAPSFTCA